MAKDSLWKSPRFGSFLESIGAFPVHREGADRLALDRSQDVLERGDALILFPEGHPAQRSGGRGAPRRGRLPGRPDGGAHRAHRHRGLGRGHAQGIEDGAAR